MVDVTGDFEIHITVPYFADKLATFAQQQQVKFSHIELDRGTTSSQPMITISGRGTLSQQQKLARKWVDKYFGRVFYPHRVKIEAAPWNTGVPQTDEDSQGEPADRYFEHHLKLVLPDATAARLIALTQLVTPHGARLSRNARRQRADGGEERFVTQRCYRVGRTTAQQQLDALAAALREAGHEIAEIEQEYVVYDDAVHLDHGWLTEPRTSNQQREDRMRHAPEGAEGYPSTYRPLPPVSGVQQRAAFDPALKQFPNAYRPGEPQFADPDMRLRWYQARQDAMAHLLRLINSSPYAKHLVLRGSVTLRAWIGDAAREPGDLDFVVIPDTLHVNDPQAQRMLDGIVAAVGEHSRAGVTADHVAAEDIWTYERAPGRRLVFPFAVPGLPGGTVQLDFVFHEKLLVAPELVHTPLIGEPVLAATAELSLAWKLLWLETDIWPQGKDLYDATVLAEHTTISLRLVRDVLRPELGKQADEFTAASVLRWTMDWDNFRDEYPTIAGDATSWQNRLALALARSFAE
jgi:hypothetical protein